VAAVDDDPVEHFAERDLCFPELPRRNLLLHHLCVSVEQW
jgi:hypothetical protein